MSNQSAPQFIEDDFGGIMAPNAPPMPELDPKRVEQRRKLFVPSFDLYLLVVVAALCAFGLLMVYSASIDASFLATEDQTTTYFFGRQLRNFGVGLVIMYVLARLDYRIWRRLSVPMMIAIMFSLVIVLQFGDRRLEAQRALFRGSFQPGEAAKLVIVIYMAAWLSSKKEKIRNITYGLLPFSIMVGVVTFLVVLQPDLSTAASIVLTALTMFFLAGASWTQIGLLAGGAAFSVWTIATQLPYAQSRIDSHLKAINDLSQANDHVQAAIVAFINGGLFGVGLGEGRQKFGALPFPHTDSVFAVIGEELGLFGTFLVIALYIMMVYRGFKVANDARDSFGSLLAAGIILWLVYDALLNIAVMTAVIPPTGVPLPFISFGGSSLVAAMAGIGLVLSVSRVSSKPLPPERQQLRKFTDAEKDETHDKPILRRLEKKPAQTHQSSQDEHVIRQAQEERRQMRREAIRQAREDRHERPHPNTESGGLPDIDNLLDTPDMANRSHNDTRYNAPSSPKQDDPPEDPEDTPPDDGPTPPDGGDNGSNSDLGGGNGRRRISRISCG